MESSISAVLGGFERGWKFPCLSWAPDGRVAMGPMFRPRQSCHGFALPCFLPAYLGHDSMNPPPLPDQVPSMRRLSSADTSIHKLIIPGTMFVICGGVFMVMLVGVFKDGRGLEGLLIAPAMAAIGYVFMKFSVWVLVDEVWEDHGWLVVRNQGREARIDLLDIIHIRHSHFSKPQTVTLILREPCVFGRSIEFLPPYRFFELGKPPVMAELAERIESKRRMAAVSGGA